jgi:hypothetical protein
VEMIIDSVDIIIGLAKRYRKQLQEVEIQKLKKLELLMDIYLIHQ